MPITDPTDIGGCVLWLAADDIVGLSDGDPVSTWVDGSEVGDATSSGSGRPTYQTNELNGLPVVRFDGVNDYLVFTDRTLGEWSAFFVVAAVGDCGLLGDADFAAPQARYGQSGGNVLSTFDGTNNPQSSTLTAARGDWVIVGFTRSGTTVTFWEGNASRGTGTHSGTNTWSALGAFRPLDPAPAAFLTGDVAEVVLYDSGLDNAERGDLVAYLTAKWFGGGGTDTPLDAQPGALTLAGASASFAIGFAGSPLSLTLAGQSASFDLGASTSPGALTLAGAAAAFGVALSGSTLALGLTGFAVTLIATGQVTGTPGGVFRRPAWSWRRSFSRTDWNRTFRRADWSRVWRYRAMADAKIPPETRTKPASEPRWMAVSMVDTPEVRAGEELSNAQVLPPGGPPGISITNPTVLTAPFDGIPAGEGVKFFVEGGTAGEVYNFAIQATADGGPAKPLVPCRIVVASDFGTN